MTRIYLDSNVFRFLKKNETEKSQMLNKYLKEYSDIFLYCYSHAHILDLERDKKSEKKYEDLAFMETFVENNYICQHWGEKNANSYLTTPLEAFNSLDPSDGDTVKNAFQDLETFFDTTQIPGIDKNAFSNLLDQKFDMGLLQTEILSEETKEALSLIIPIDKNEITWREWFDHFAKMYERLNEDKDAYKNLRGYLVKSLNLEKYNIDFTNNNFNEDLKNTPLQKTFFDYVKNSLDPDGKKQISRYDFFNHAFTCLNILGIDKEKNAKAKFANTINDAQHSYYGAHCNYVISDDVAFLKKSEAMYKLLRIDTKF